MNRLANIATIPNGRWRCDEAQFSVVGKRISPADEVLVLAVDDEGHRAAAWTPCQQVARVGLESVITAFEALSPEEQVQLTETTLYSLRSETINT